MYFGINANLNATAPTMYDMVGNWPGADLGQSNLWGFNGIGTLAGAYGYTGELSAATPWLSIGQTAIQYGDTAYTHAMTGEVGLFDFNYNFSSSSHTPIYEYNKQLAAEYNVQIGLGAQYFDGFSAVGVFAGASLSSPIILDLSGDGQQAGLLVFDANADNQITDNELMDTTGINGEPGKYRSGWEKALSLADLNRDGFLRGSELSGFSVFADGNANGVTDAGELMNLSSLEVYELNSWDGSYTRRREVGALDIVDGHVYSATPGPNNTSVYPGASPPVVKTPGPVQPEPPTTPPPVLKRSDTPTQPAPDCDAQGAASATTASQGGMGMGPATPPTPGPGAPPPGPPTIPTPGPYPGDPGVPIPAPYPNPPDEPPSFATPPSFPGMPAPGPRPPDPPPAPPIPGPGAPPTPPTPGPGAPPPGPPTIPTPGPYPGDPGAPIPYPYPGVPNVPIPYPYPGVPDVPIPYPYPGIPNLPIPGPYPGTPQVPIPWPYPGSWGLPIPGGYPSSPGMPIPWPYPYPF